MAAHLVSLGLSVVQHSLDLLRTGLLHAEDQRQRLSCCVLSHGPDNVELGLVEGAGRQPTWRQSKREHEQRPGCALLTGR